jgi:ABC-2 type transport system permease protein
MRAALLIAGKDLRQRVRDRTAIITAVAVPLIVATILGATIPSTTIRGDTKFTFGVVNQDTGPTGLFFVKEILGPLQRQNTIGLHPASSVSEGRALVRNGQATATVVIPPNFSRATERETATHLEIVGSRQILKQAGTYVARSIALAFTDQLNSVRLAEASVRKATGRTSSEFDHVGEQAGEMTKPLQLHEAHVPDKELALKAHEAAGMAILFLFITVQFGFPSIIDERNHGTFTRLLAASVSRWSIIFGKLLTSIVLGLLSTVVLLTATALILGVHWGDVPGLALIVVASVIAATALAACIATFATTTEMAGQRQLIVAVMLGALGGAMFPIAQAGGTLQSLSLLTPQAQFLRGLGLLANGGGPSTVLPMVWAILAFAAVFGAIALLRIRNLVEL